MPLLKQFLIIAIVAGAILSLGFALAQSGPDGAHSHPGYETRLADHDTQIAMLWGTVVGFSISTEVATLVNTPIQVLPSPTPRTFTPTPPPTRTATPTAGATNTLLMPPTSTPEELLATYTPTPTFFNTTNTFTPTRTAIQVTLAPTLTPTPGASPTSTTDPIWLNGCAPNADFAPKYTVNTRAEPRVTAQRVDSVSPTDTVIVCAESLTSLDADGYRWMQIVSSVRIEWFVVYGNGEWWGVLIEWPD